MYASKSPNTTIAPVTTLFEIVDHKQRAPGDKYATSAKGFLLQTRNCSEYSQSQTNEKRKNWLKSKKRSHYLHDVDKEAATLSKERETIVWRMLQSATYGKPNDFDLLPQTARLDSTHDEKLTMFNESQFLNKLKSARQYQSNYEAQ